MRDPADGRMPEVDFYIVHEAAETATMRVACRIAEKAWSQGHRVHVLTRDEDEAARIDEFLWTFRQDSFVPHERWDGRGEVMAPVTVGSSADLERTPDVLVNLGDVVPPWFGECTRVAEIVAADPERRSAGRRRYREYRDARATLRTHEV